jgi:hypothetical protein
MSSPSDNLQKISTSIPVKNDIIAACPYRPTNRGNANVNLLLIGLWYCIQPITKHISNIGWWRNIIREINDAPNHLYKWTSNEQMINGLSRITKTTFLTSIPLPFS